MTLVAWLLLTQIILRRVFVFVTVRLFPPDVETVDDDAGIRGILYGVPPAISRAAEEPAMEDTPAVDSHPAISTLDRERWTAEGAVMAFFAALMFLYIIWSAVRPFVYQALPELNATREGPRAFPIAAHIGEEDVAFTNGSDLHWTCRAGLGLGSTLNAAFDLDPRQTLRVPYEAFQQSDPNLSLLARDRIRVECRDETGRTHSLDLM